MKKAALILVGMLMLSTLTASANQGWIDSERFGYAGTITRYADAGLTEQVGDVILTGPRDVCLWSDSDYPASVVMGSWWYSIAGSGAGYGNVNGNTGPGFMQYYDLDQAYVVSQSYAFSNFDGTYWTDFSFSLEVAMSEAGASSRLSAPANTGDAGYYQSLLVSLTATGLQGVENGGMIIAEEADAYATGVLGSISGVFVNTSSTTANNGYYVFDFTMSMDNWSYENRDSLVAPYDTFYAGSFAAVPEPATMTLLGLGSVVALLRRRK